MLAVFNELGDRCFAGWTLGGLHVTDYSVEAIIYNTQGMPFQEYKYTEEDLLEQIERAKDLRSTGHGMHRISILSSGLLAMRKYKLSKGLYS